MLSNTPAFLRRHTKRQTTDPHAASQPSCVMQTKPGLGGALGRRPEFTSPVAAYAIRTLGDPGGASEGVLIPITGSMTDSESGYESGKRRRPKANDQPKRLPRKTLQTP